MLVNMVFAGPIVTGARVTAVLAVVLVVEGEAEVLLVERIIGALSAVEPLRDLARKKSLSHTIQP